MKKENREMLEEMQEKMRESDINYANNAVYGTALMLDAALNEELTAQEAVNEYLQNTDMVIKQ